MFTSIESQMELLRKMGATDFMSLQEAATASDKTYQWLWKQKSIGVLRSHKIGRAVKIELRDLAEWTLRDVRKAG